MTTAYENDYYANDMDELIDLLLNAKYLRKAFITKGSKMWIDRVSDDFLRMGLRELSARQIYIVEGLMLRDKSIIDICFELGIQYEVFQSELKDMRNTLSKYL